MKIEEISERKTQVLASLLRERSPAPQSILVVGCGDGLEAGILARFFGARTVGIDLGGQFVFSRDAAPAVLLHMDARDLDFPDDSFDLVYSFHALEHIDDPKRALSEMSRVLKAGGTFCIGTPNKKRLIGYVGAPTSLANKVSWNLTDWRMRVTGRWENALKAHAGFQSRELTEMCLKSFGSALDVSDQYYSRLYPNHRLLLGLVVNTPLKWLVLPCCYTIGMKILH